LGSERGYCVVMGQKVPIERPRVRTIENQEVKLEEGLRQHSPLVNHWGDVRNT
jgi:hypothetical protein